MTTEHSIRLRPQRSFRLSRFGAPLEATTNDVPVPVGTQVLVKVMACGVCHSDLHIAEGFFDLGGGKRMDLAKGIQLPRTLGHEIAGEVVAVGEQVQGLTGGERGVVFPWIGCSKCSLCLVGDEHLCARPGTLGTTVDGGFSTHVMLPHPRYLLDLGDLSTEHAATLACSGLTAYSALRKAGPISADRPLLILGAGGVGLAAVSIAKAIFGVGPIVADIDPGKREGALAAGASLAVDPSDREVRRQLMQQTDGGVAAAVDFVGASSSAEFALSLLRKGGRLVSVGLFGGSIELPLPTLPMRAISIAGSWVGSLAEMQELLALARSGAVPAMPLETRPLAQAQATMDELRQGRVRGRAVLLPEA